MDLHGISVGSLLVIFLIAVLLFGPKRLRAMAEDLAVALRNFNKTLRSQKDAPPSKESKSESLNNDSH